MNRRTFTILAAAAVVLALLAVLGQNRDGGGSIAGDSAGEPVLPGLAADLDDIGLIEVTGAGGERLVGLEQGGDGWSVAELDGYPAETGAVNGLLIALGEARIVEEKTSDPDFYSRLGVEAVTAADATGLELTLTSGDDTRYEIVLGDSYGSGQRYARLADSEQSVLIDADPDVARSPSDWVRPGIVDIPGARIQRVEIRHADGETLAIYKDARDAADFSVEAIPEGRELQYAGVANVTGNALASLTLEAVEPAPAAVDEPETVIEYSTFDGLVLTVTAEAGEEENPWLRFAARFDAAQADAFAAPPADDDGADGEAADTDPAAEADIAAEAEAINARVEGWRYRIPSFKYGQMTRRMDDLLRAPAEAPE